MSGGEDLSVQQLFAEKWDNFTVLIRDITFHRFPLLFEQLATLPDNPEDALVLIATYGTPMRVFIDTRAEAELLQLLTSYDEALAKEAEALAECINSHTKHKLWRYGAFFLEVVDTLTQQPK